MTVIGVTGRSGAGKSTFSNMLAESIDGKYVDVDKIGHDALAHVDVDKLWDSFGRGILNEDGTVNRKKLGAVVFSDSNKMQILYGLTYGYMKDVILKIIEDAECPIILDYALLPECQEIVEQCDYMIMVDAEKDMRKQKVMERDHISEEYFEMREQKKADYFDGIHFDYTVMNDYTTTALQDFAKSISTDILNRRE